MFCTVILNLGERLKVRYFNQLPTSKTGIPKHNVFQYVKLAIVEKDKAIKEDEHYKDVFKLQVKGKVGQILKKKQPFFDLKEIFNHGNKPCPRLILLMGTPGE